ncbi:MAG TPA: SusC/RagA family TonB-linked outer membrane protein [Chitinophagaceae bacterium]|nr:SusC/RagA family TonB-linked outer membrane protein [Chitinophagaceae bacterium]
MSAKTLFSALLCILFTFVVQSSYAQDRVVTGIVTDSKDGTPVSGASVQAKGTRTGTSTKTDGSFTISIAPGVTTLIISSIGYETQEVSVEGKSSVEVAFVVTVGANLNEVVVTGYGTAKKKDLTGSVGSLKDKDFNKGVFTSADQLIQGKLSGVQVVNNSGQPGGATTVKIRGSSALTGSGQPLYVVDGVPLDGRSPRPGLGDIGLGGSNPGNNPLNFINPADIASIDVLKDASATAIYGSRAAYGVVMITTKKGKSGEPRIDVSSSIGFSKILKQIEILNAAQYRQALTYYGLGTANDKGANVDAMGAILRTAVVHNHNVAISGGTTNAKYRFSFGLLDQEGIVRKSGIKKYTANLSGNFKFLDNKRLGLDVNVIPSQYMEEIAPISNNAGSRGSLIGNALQWNPTENLIIKRSNGTDSLNVKVGGDLLNPLAVSEAFTDKAKVTTILGSVSPYYKLTDDLEYRMVYSIAYGTGLRGTTVKPFINFNDTYGKGRVRLAQSQLTTQQVTHTVSYTKQLASSVNVNAVAGYEYLSFKNKGYDLNGFGQVGALGGFGDFGLEYEDYIQYTDPTNRTINSYSDPTNELQSYFVRTEFNIQDKYLVKGSFRADGSTKFGKNNKYGYFPAFAVAWNISRESFFKVPLINSLKLRASWGKTGNQEFPSGSAQLRYSFSGNGSGAFNAANNANPDLKWQSDRQYNIGFDAQILKNRITIVVDYFNKRTTDLLFPSEPAQPAAPGGVVKWVNLDGNIDNKGVEAAVNASIITQRDLTWDFGVNGTFVTNKVSNLSSSINTGSLDGQGITGTTVQVIRNGLPINAFFTRQFLGFDKSTGLAMYTNDGDLLYYVGNPNPKALLGISTTVRYKKLTLTANLNGAFGHDIYNNTLNSVINVGSINNGKNIALSVFRDPVKESFANPLTASSRFLENGNYLKMANATISYMIGDIGKSIKGLTVYVNGQNLFVITQFSGFDPEVNVDKNINGVPSTGIEYIPYPSARTFNFGINVGF